MKKALLTLLILSVTTAARAQERRFDFSVAVGTALSLDKPSVTPLFLELNAWYRIGTHFSFGIGTGYIQYEKALLPLTGNLRLLLIRPRRFTPYLSCGAGYAFALSKETNGGLHLHPEAGVQYALPHGMRLFLGIGYSVQRLERLKRHSNDLFEAAYCERLRHSAVSLKVGLLF